MDLSNLSAEHLLPPVIPITEQRLSEPLLSPHETAHPGQVGLDASTTGGGNQAELLEVGHRTSVCSLLLIQSAVAWKGDTLFFERVYV